MRRTLPILVGAAFFVLTAGAALAQEPSSTSPAVPGAASTPGGQTQPMKHTHKTMRHHRMHHKHHHNEMMAAPSAAATP